jgi:tetratricopeptide (TPR) repeat protein
MKKWIKILLIFAFTAPTIILYSQSEYCPEMQLLIQKYKNKDYNGAKNYLDTVINKCPSRAKDAYLWHISGFIYFDVFKYIDNRSPISKSREMAVESFINSKKFDTKQKYVEHNEKAIKILASTYYNDAFKILNKRDTVLYENAYHFYSKYKSITNEISSNSNFDKKDVDFNHGLGIIYKIKYENDKKAYRHFMDSAINCFKRSIAINPDQYSSNYNLGIIYHNLGVDIILNDLEIDADLEKVIIMQEKAISYFSKALPYLTKVYQIKPTDKEIIQGIAAVYYSLNDMEKHVEYMNVLRELDSSTPSNNKK